MRCTASGGGSRTCRASTYLERVDDIGQSRSHWVAKGPAGMRVEWDAEIINEVENKVIGWHTLPGSFVTMADR